MDGIPDSMPVLGRGRHRSPGRGACFLEYTSLLAGEPFTDAPRCVDAELAGVLRHANDVLSAADPPRPAPRPRPAPGRARPPPPRPRRARPAPPPGAAARRTSRAAGGAPPTFGPPATGGGGGRCAGGPSASPP